MHQDRQRRGRRVAPAAETAPGGVSGAILSFFRNRAIREIVESVVIAFALAFLFRSFLGEVFVIPTGSMAPTLYGRHRDVKCPQCAFRYRVSASMEIDQVTERQIGEVVAGTCPQCGFTACLNCSEGQVIQRDARGHDADIGLVFNSGALPLCQDRSSSGGNRILVAKSAYDLREPRRWDVFVFRPPGDAAKNYIKRLVGLPGETARIYRGDLYTGEYNADAFANPAVQSYEIERKPADKVLAMKQLVYNNDDLLDSMTKKGWPTRWSAWPRGAPAGSGDWKSSDGTRSFTVAGTATAPQWIRYQHFQPNFGDWEELLSPHGLSADFRQQIRPQLVTDMYGYNSSVGSLYGRSLQLKFSDSTFQGLNWVRDLVLECELTVEKPQGAALLELVAGGVPFRCRIDLASGNATLSMDKQGPQYVFTGAAGSHAQVTGATPMRHPGRYRVRLANVDYQLHLWVNNKLVTLSAPATYDLHRNQSNNFVPQTDAQGGLDLAPAGVGSDGAALHVTHLRLDRDVYYVAVSEETLRGQPMDFFESNLPPLLVKSLPSMEGINADFQPQRAELFSTPGLWPRAFGELKEIAFPLANSPEPNEDQFLALGDNSPQSKDSRLWEHTNGMKKAKLGQREYYVERELLIGKALLVYWPLMHVGFVR